MNASDKLLSLVASAFAHTQRPEDNGIVNWPREDQLRDVITLEELVERFRGKRWQDLSAGFVNEDPQEMLFLSPEGFQYFLPAWMSLYLRSPDALETALSVLLFRLGSAGGEYSEEARKYTRDLDSSQKACLLDFLSHVSASHRNPVTRSEAEAAWKTLSGTH